MRSLTIAVAAIGLLFSASVFASPTRVDQLVRAALQLDPNIKRGGGLYEVHCARCHGQGAIGDSRKVIPALAGQRGCVVQCATGRSCSTTGRCVTEGAA